MNKRITFLAASLALAICLPAQAAGDASAGKTKAATCQACHGPDGNSVDPQYPRLAGQYADYLVQALKDYQSGARNNAIMKGFAAGLSEQDMADLAAYFSAQRGLIAPSAPKTVPR